jgi:hypothetical protein
MDILDRYLKDVRTHLPRDHQDDIVRELSENLRSKIEDREAELGRALTEAETGALLDDHGHPVTVAGRYRTHPRSLVIGREWIGPGLFPLYLRILLLNLGLTLVGCVVILIVVGFRTIEPIVSTAFLNLALQATIVTAIFVAAQRDIKRNPKGWGARMLHTTQAAESRARPSRAGPVFELIVLLVVGLWWLSLPRQVAPFVDSMDAIMRPGPVWSALWLAVLVLTIGQIGLTCVAIARPDRTRLQSAGRMVVHGLTALVGFACVAAGGWVLEPTGGEELAKRLLLARSINQWSGVIVATIAAINALLALLGARRLMRAPDERAPSAAT